MRSGGKGRGGSDKGSNDAAFQVIVLGSTGGPREDSVTGMLVRSSTSHWAKGSIVAVDAGSHLANIIRILEEYMPASSKDVPPEDYKNVLKDGPFAGLEFPHITAKANGLHVFRELVHSFLISHPHLDHVGGLAVNTPGLEYGKEAKNVVALPGIIEAIRTHIFNDLIWPNLSDEDNGVGFITYKRLIEGGNPRLGAGGSRGYVHVCEGLVTKCWAVTHGRCKRRPSHQRGSGLSFNGDFSFPSRRMSRVSDDYGYVGSGHHPSQYNAGAPQTPGPAPSEKDTHLIPVDSSAFFLRSEDADAEIIVFGDLEPDSLSLQPRNHVVWDDAAPKIISGSLRAIFIECSFADDTPDEDLYGHLCPRHLIAELSVLGHKVVACKRDNNVHMNLQEPPSPTLAKRKRTNGHHDSNGNDLPRPSSPRKSRRGSRETIRSRSPAKHRRNMSAPHRTKQGNGSSLEDGDPLSVAPLPGRLLNNESAELPMVPVINESPPEGRPLQGLAVHVIHVKETLKDGPDPRDVILKELLEWEAKVQLGCTFRVTGCGESLWI